MWSSHKAVSFSNFSFFRINAVNGCDLLESWIWKKRIWNVNGGNLIFDCKKNILISAELKRLVGWWIVALFKSLPSSMILRSFLSFFGITNKLLQNSNGSLHSWIMLIVLYLFQNFTKLWSCCRGYFLIILLASFFVMHL